MGLGVGAAGHVPGPVRFHQLFKAGPGGLGLCCFIVAQSFLADIRFRTARNCSGKNQRKHSPEAIS